MLQQCISGLDDDETNTLKTNGCIAFKILLYR